MHSLAARLTVAADRIPEPSHASTQRIIRGLAINSHDGAQVPRSLAIHPRDIEARPSRCPAHPGVGITETRHASPSVAKAMHPGVATTLAEHADERAPRYRMQLGERTGGPDPDVSTGVIQKQVCR